MSRKGERNCIILCNYYVHKFVHLFLIVGQNYPSNLSLPPTQKHHVEMKKKMIFPEDPTTTPPV